MVEEVKKTSAYWNLINKVTNRKECIREIGPLKRDDGSHALLDKEKAQRMNSCFIAIGENLINSLPMPTQHALLDNNTSLSPIPAPPFVLLTNYMAVMVAFVDFRKAFNSVSNEILVKKLQNSFGITGALLDWIKDYLSGRRQFTVINGVESDILPVTTGIPQ